MVAWLTIALARLVLRYVAATATVIVIVHLVLAVPPWVMIIRSLMIITVIVMMNVSLYVEVIVNIMVGKNTSRG